MSCPIEHLWSCVLSTMHQQKWTLMEKELQPAVVLSILGEKKKIAVFSLSKQMLITSIRNNV